MGVPHSHLQFPMQSMFDWKKKTTETSTGDKIRMMSWNILAQRLVSQDFFPYVKPQYLSYDYRIDLIKRFIYFQNCEILCLQEVDSTNSFFDFLSDMGYTYYYRPKGPLQGILTAFKKSLFQVIEQKQVDYDSLITPPFKREVYSTGHGAILLKLLYKGMHKLIVANTHLFWVPRFQKIKYHQVSSVISQMNNFSRKDEKCYKFLMGDFNSTPSSNCMKLITENSSPQYDICFEAHSNYRQMYEKYNQSHHNLFKMKNTFDSDSCRFTNLTNKFRGEDKNLEVQQVLSLPRQQLLKKQVALPNSIIPSDHLPLVCDFRFKTTDESIQLK